MMLTCACHDYVLVCSPVYKDTVSIKRSSRILASLLFVSVHYGNRESIKGSHRLRMHHGAVNRYCCHVVYSVAGEEAA